CLHQDLFPRGYHELKGVQPSLNEMKIKLKDDTWLVHNWPYGMYPNLLIKVKDEIDEMIKACIIKPIEESERISPMVINIKNNGRIMICVDYQ
ncbi:hypothetical protein KI387_028573, partial [Taxus chinensis]